MVLDLDKYQAASKIVQDALNFCISKCTEGAKIVDICRATDTFIEDASKAVYGKIKYKGVAFPCTVSPSNYICHFAPLESDRILAKGEIVKIEVGAHIDGFASQSAHTLVIGATKEHPVTGVKADVIQAAHLAAEAAIRLMRPGNTNYQVSEVVEKIAKDHGCVPVEGMLSHQLEKDVLDGEKCIIFNAPPEQRRDIKTVKFESGEVYSLDILVSSGDGKPRVTEDKTTIFKRNQDVVYSLKTKSGRAALSEIKEKFGMMCFSLGKLDAKFGLNECLNHGLVVPYQVLVEKKDASVAHFMFTVVIQANRTIKLTSYPYNADLVNSDKKVQDPSILTLLEQDIVKIK